MLSSSRSHLCKALTRLNSGGQVSKRVTTSVLAVRALSTTSAKGLQVNELVERTQDLLESNQREDSWIAPFSSPPVGTDFYTPLDEIATVAALNLSTIM